MTTNKKGINLIKKYEGLRLKTYLCPAGVPTIGYGHTGKVNGKKLDIKKPITITEVKAEELLKGDLAVYEVAVGRIDRKYNYGFTKNEFSALVSFAYNLGWGTLELLCKEGKRNKREIADAILLYNKANGKVLQGLVNRRKAERKLFLTK